MSSEADPQAVPLREERLAALGLLRAIYLGVRPEDLAGKLAVLARSYSGCEAVAIRLRNGPDFPYVASLGFDPEFIRLENRLCALDEHGQVLRDEYRRPIHECMCGIVLAGRVDPEKSYFSAKGSFFTLSTSDLLESIPEAERPDRTRNRCHTAGYESVGLFPIRRGMEVYGLIQCNDRRRDRLGPAQVELLEELTDTAAHLFQLSMM